MVGWKPRYYRTTSRQLIDYDQDCLCVPGWGILWSADTTDYASSIGDITITERGSRLIVAWLGLKVINVYALPYGPNNCIIDIRGNCGLPKMAQMCKLGLIIATEIYLFGSRQSGLGLAY